MCSKLLLWLFATAILILQIVKGYELNMTQYYKMPPLSDFEDYDRCLREFDSLSTYCFVRADIIPQNDSESWQIIKEMNQYSKHNFNHRHLHFGICVHWCEKMLAELPQQEVTALFAGILTNNSKVNISLRLFADEEPNRQLYNKLMNQCINLKLKKGHYGVSAESVVEYCSTNKQVIKEDNWDLAFTVILWILITLTAASSLYDLYLRITRNEKSLTARDHYKSPVSGFGNKVCVTFSVARNWYRLNQAPNGVMGRELRFLDCFKFCAMFLVIFAHTNWIFYATGISNPQDPEQMLRTVAGTLLVAGGLITITFFVISGLLLTINWLALTKTHDEMSALQYVVAFIKFNVFRYIRLTVPYAFVILASGVYFGNLGGPAYRHVVETEQLSCRKNWWVNLLYINNYVNTNEMCLLQGWYLAADTQSFILSLLVLMLAHKWPKIRNTLFAVVMCVFIILPGLLTYFYNMEPIFVPRPQVQRDLFMESHSFQQFYIPTHMNFVGYFAGVLAALVYDHLTVKKIHLRQYKSFQLVFYALIPIGVLWMFSAHWLLQEYYAEPPRVWGSIYAAIQRNIWGIGLSVVVVGMTAKVGWVLRKFCCLPIFRILGRLTYGAFILHMLVGRSVLGTIRTPIFHGPGIMFSFIVFNVITSYLLSFVLAILLELPVSSLLKLLR